MSTYFIEYACNFNKFISTGLLYVIVTKSIDICDCLNNSTFLLYNININIKITINIINILI